MLKVTENAAQQFTSKSSLVEALLDAVGSAHMEGLGDFLVHETLSVEDVCHHHPQVKDLQQLCDGGDLHQISSALVQTACVQVLKHRLEPEDNSFTLDAYCFADRINIQFSPTVLAQLPDQSQWSDITSSQ